MKNRIMQSMWTGAPITTMERLCMQSYMTCGHEFHLYCYEDLGPLPAGVVVKDANEIVPMDRLIGFSHKQQMGDYFRIVLLLQKGGWWVDLDSVCLKYFDFPEEYVFCEAAAARFIQNNPIKAPADSQVMKYCFAAIKNMDQTAKRRASFHKIGPELLRQAVTSLGMQHYVKPLEVFDPIRWDRASLVIDPFVEFDLTKSSAVHWFHGAWNGGSQAKFHKISPQTDGKYPENCLYERMKRRYGVS